MTTEQRIRKIVEQFQRELLFSSPVERAEKLENAVAALMRLVGPPRDAAFNTLGISELLNKNAELALIIADRDATIDVLRAEPPDTDVPIEDQIEFVKYLDPEPEESHVLQAALATLRWVQGLRN